jgi:AcrR family transcriptional regulator
MCRFERHTLLDTAEGMLRNGSYSAFSLNDLASSTSMNTSEVICYFPTKEAVLTALIRKRSAQLKIELRDISDAYHDAESRLVAYACLISEGFEGTMSTLSDSMTAARSDVPKAVGREVAKLLRLQLEWIQNVVQEHGLCCGQPYRTPPEIAARLIFSALEGDAVIDRALGANEPSAVSFIQILEMLGISRK